MTTLDPTNRPPSSTVLVPEIPPNPVPDFVDPDNDEDCRAGLLEVDGPDDDDDGP
ncbi:MAG TPA: hypothetical protein VJ890_27345 [Vineibacter sp.]|nr:hypothetical protein [Vineibacter sp.]